VSFSCALVFSRRGFSERVGVLDTTGSKKSFRERERERARRRERTARKTDTDAERRRKTEKEDRE